MQIRRDGTGLELSMTTLDFFHGYYVRKGYTTLFRVPNWLGRILTKSNNSPMR